VSDNIFEDTTNLVEVEGKTARMSPSRSISIKFVLSFGCAWKGEIEVDGESKVDIETKEVNDAKVENKAGAEVEETRMVKMSLEELTALPKSIVCWLI